MLGLLPFVRALLFANEIGPVCQQAGIDEHVVMTVFRKNTALNIVPIYLMPGLALGGSRLPKDVRALLYAAKQGDIDLPPTVAILPNNQKGIDRAFEIDDVLTGGNVWEDTVSPS